MIITQHLDPTETDIARAADLLRSGALVAFPTETVYGLGGLATHDAAVAGIYTAKGRPGFNPLIVHLAHAADIAAFAVMSPVAQSIAEQFWPGPLTMVLPLRDGHGLSPRVTAGLDSVGIRIPAHPLARQLLSAVGGPVAAPSANLSGQISPTTAEHVLKGLDGRIGAVLDGGPCAVGLESTIIDLTEPGVFHAPRLLRAGGIPAETLEAAIGQRLATPTANPDAPKAPGQLSSHYAPRARLRLNARKAERGEVMLGFGPMPGDWTLSRKGNLEEAAACLFCRLHEMDAAGVRAIAVAPVPEIGLGRAINDRLRRAAAPRG